MVKELKKRFIKTTMLVVTILLVVFLASINIINNTLSKRDCTSRLNQIISLHLRAVPGIPAANSGMGVQNGTSVNESGPNNNQDNMDPGEPIPASDTSGTNPQGNSSLAEGMTGPEILSSPTEGMTEPEILSSPTEGMTEPEIPNGPMVEMTEPDGSTDLQESMSEGGPDSETPDSRIVDLGRYAIARVNAEGAIVFKNYNHDPSLSFSGLVDLINAAEVSFAPKATGETETEEIFGAGIGPNSVQNEGSNPPSDEGSVPPMNEGSNPPSDEGSVPPMNEGSNPPSDEGSVPPSNEGNNPAANGEGNPLAEAGAAPADEGTTQPKEQRGTVNGYMYYAAQQADGSVLYAFLNISEQIDSVLRIFLITIVMGVALWILILFVVMLLSAKAIAPIAENIEKQRQFITDAGHEIKTPLAVIVSNVDVQELHSGKTKWLDNIRTQALRLSELTRQMLTLSKMEESGTTAFVATTFDASKELEDMVQIFRESASLRDIEIKTDIEPGVQVHFSKEQYHRMAELLLDNAMKYGKEHGFLSVSLHSERKTITLSFKNNCDQLPDIDPDRLFERFYRSDSSRSRQTGGSGIGLAVVRAIAEHGGGYAKAHFLPNEVIEFEIQLLKKN